MDWHLHTNIEFIGSPRSAVKASIMNLLVKYRIRKCPNVIFERSVSN